jgi:predicted ATPase
MFFGEFATTLRLLEQCEGLSHPAHRAVYATQAADDIHSIILTYRAIVLTILGHVDQGQARMDEALKEAKQLGHTYTLAQVTAYRCWIDWMTDRSHALAQHSAESEALSIEHGFSFWTTVARSYRGFAQAVAGNPKDGLTLLQDGLSTMRATGAVVSTPLFVTMISDTCNRLGWSAESANWLSEAMEIVDATGERMVETEVHRVGGDRLAAAGDLTDAQQLYEQAIRVAQRQSAKIYELRAATSLARLWRDQGRRTEAHDLLAPIYGWFTEGFDTPVLKEAKALLDELK